MELDKYTSWGCYPLAYLIDNQCQCNDCATMTSIHTEESPIAFVNWENSDLYCDECGERIESAYSEEEEGGENA